jgi:drug/metabolite transporter (DMT)-like permease
MWLLGMVTMGGTFVFTALALYFGTLASVQPILVTELIFTLALRVVWLRDRIARRTWGAAALLCAGLFGFLVVADPQEGHGHPGPARWVVAVGSRGLVVLVLVIISRWGSPARRAAVLGAAAALVWAVDAAFVKTATEVLAHHGWGGLFVHWPIYGVVATGVLGTVLLESAFAVGPLAASQSALLIVDPLASIAIGIELFGEQLRSSPGAIVLQAVFLGGMFVGVVLLSKWAPPEMEMRKRRPEPTVATVGGASGVAPGPA